MRPEGWRMFHVLHITQYYDTLTPSLCDRVSAEAFGRYLVTLVQVVKSRILNETRRGALQHFTQTA